MSLAARVTRAPIPFDAARGQDVAADYGATGPLRDLIAGTAGSSPYLHGLLVKERAWAESAFDDPEAAFDALLAGTATQTASNGTQLRIAKGRMALLVALCDLGGLWSLEEVTGALSRFADVAVDRALSVALAPLQAAGKLPSDPKLTVLAMGKLGAQELNYSSDIDLICLFDDAGLDSVAAAERRGPLIRAVRAAMKDLSEVTAEGYVFRTDLRLRPDAAVTPIVLAQSVAEAYYESVGRTWERAAYIKARAAAGDRAAGERFLAALTPFIWRRHLDFAAIEDAHDILRKIRDHRGLQGPISLPGHDMKLGRGGIREIEFFVQTRQLISGGRDPNLRPAATRPALAALTAAGWVDAEAKEVLDRAYVSHRTVEHRLQMLRDAQTHALPQSDEGMARLAAFMGIEMAELRSQLKDTLEAVHALTEPFFAPDAAGPAPEQSFGQDITARWRTYPALRTARACRLFDRLEPRILARLAAAADPDRALRHFDAFLAGLPAGVQVFSLFEANPDLIDLLADIAALAPALAEYLGRNAQVLDAVLDGAFFAPWPGLEALTRDLTDRMAAASDYEAKLDAARAWMKEQHFRIGVHHLRGLADAAVSGACYADLAQAVLAALYPVVAQHFALRHGPAPGAGGALVAMGSLGAGRLHAASDLDLILVYDAAGQEASEGPKPMATRAYYARLTQALITALTAPMAQGRLYEVDMRLRPSGRNGPLATSLQSFDSYQQGEAWVWEHLALTRARPVAGAAVVGAAVEAVRQRVLAAPRNRADVGKEVADMRRRIIAARPGEGGLAAKDGPGRLQDLELFAQSLALLAGAAGRGVPDQLAQAAGAGYLTSKERDMLAAHDTRLWRLRAATRLILKPGQGADTAVAEAAGSTQVLLAGTGQESLEALSDEVAKASADVADLFDARLSAWQASV